MGDGSLDDQANVEQMSLWVLYPHAVSQRRAWHQFLTSRCFSTSAAPMAPGTRDPSAKTRVGVPVILCLWPISTLRVSAAVSQLAAAGNWSRTIQSCQT